MAEGFLKHLASDRFEVFSAGTNPTQLNPLAVRAMAEIGIDISNQKSKSVKEFLGQKFDYVITVCDSAKETCPVFPGKYKSQHWRLEDPAQAQGTNEEKLLIFRKIRDNIKEEIIKFLDVS